MTVRGSRADPALALALRARRIANAELSLCERSEAGTRSPRRRMASLLTFSCWLTHCFRCPWLGRAPLISVSLSRELAVVATSVKGNFGIALRVHHCAQRARGRYERFKSPEASAGGGAWPRGACVTLPVATARRPSSASARSRVIRLRARCECGWLSGSAGRTLSCCCRPERLLRMRSRRRR